MDRPRPESAPDFAQLVSLACHDLRTPLATVHGFARTLTRLEDVGETTARYLGLIEAASEQLTELLDDLGLVARVEGGRWEPNLQETDLLELTAAAAELVEEGVVDLSGPGGRVHVDRDAMRRAIYNLARCALRHGMIDRVEVVVDGTELRLAPVGPDVAPIILGRDLRDLGAAVAVRVVEALGGTAEVDGTALRVRLAG